MAPCSSLVVFFALANPSSLRTVSRRCPLRVARDLRPSFVARCQRPTGQIQYSHSLTTMRLPLHSKHSTSTFQAYEDYVFDRIQESQRHADVMLSLDDDDDDDSTFNHVVRMSHLDEALRQTDNAKMKEITALMKENGGYLIIELDNDPFATRILRNMWHCLQGLSFPNDASSSFDKSDGRAPLFRQQVLTGDNLTETNELLASGGYKYVETSIRRTDGVLSVAGSDDARSSLDAILGANGRNTAALAFQLLLAMANAIVLTTCISLESTLADKTNLSEALNRIVDNGEPKRDDLAEADTPWSCSVHRLCRYATRNNNGSNDKVVEYIRSHTDWTLLTLVPVATVAGLEIWNPTKKVWTRPEWTARQHWDEHLASGDNDDVDHFWNSRYVVVMGGKWLEIITKEKVPAAVHRVAATSSATDATSHEARMSAPFFLRPRNSIGIDLQKRFGSKSNDIFDVLDEGARSAVEHLHFFLRQNFL